MTNREDIRTRLRQFVKAELARNQAGLDVEKESLVESGIIDSLGIMKLVQYIEKEFRVQVSDQELLPENFDTLDAMTDFLAAKVR